MPRIPDDEIERLKRETKLEDLVRARGIDLKKHGENLLGLCPFHDDREPSLVVTPAKNLWNCLGACGGGGDVIEWVMKSRNVGFRGAVEILWEREGSGPVTKTKTKGAKLPPLPLEGKKDPETLSIVIDYYHERLSHPASPGGLEYLERRGVRSDEAIERFRIGFGDRTLGLRVPGKEYKAGREIRDRLQAIGLLRASTGREHFNGCVVFPITNPTDDVVEVYGRKIADDQRHRHGKHLYLPGPHRGIWNGEVIGQTDELIICESILDALSFWVHGFRDVIAAFGVNGFTDEMFVGLADAGIERLLIAYDRDDAGDRAATKLAEKLANEGIGSFRVLFPRGMDANDTIRTMTPARKSLELLLRSAEWMAGPKERSALGKQRPMLAGGDVDAPIIAVGEDVVSDERRAASESEVVRDERREMSSPPPEELLSLAAASKVEKTEEAAKEETVEEPAGSSLAAHRSPLAASPDYSCIEVTLGERHYRIRGLEKCATYAQLKVLVRVTRGEQLFVDQLDFIQARQRAQFIKHAAEDLGLKEEIIKNDLAVVYRELERLQDEMIRRLLEPKETTPVMSEPDVRDAMRLLQERDLITRIVDDLDRCGLVGERTNKLMTYLAAVSRKLDDPLAILIQSSSAAGKTTVMDAILRMMPDEEQERYSAVTGKALFYISEETSLRHKILAISEEEGAEQAAYALKLLQSEGKLSIASTGKDTQTGKLVTQEYHVEGPVMILLTTTAIEIDEELLNRCIVLTVDEERAQTRAIHDLQRRAQTLEGLVAKIERDRVALLHQNAQRLLRPVHVTIPEPIAKALTFLDAQIRTRRDHMKYLTLIRTIALVHQFQRPKRTHRLPSGKSIEYIEVTVGDVVLANELAHEVLGHSLDELPPQTRRLLRLIDDVVSEECERRHIQRRDFRFSRRTVRDRTGWGDTQLKTHLRRLEELEYLLVHRGGRGQSFVYELLYDGQRDRDRYLPGLADVARLASYDANRAGLESEKSGHRDEKSGLGRPLVGGVSGGGRSDEDELKPALEAALSDSEDEPSEKSPLGPAESEAVVALAFPKPEKRGGRSRLASSSFGRVER